MGQLVASETQGWSKFKESWGLPYIMRQFLPPPPLIPIQLQKIHKLSILPHSTHRTNFVRHCGNTRPRLPKTNTEGIGEPSLTMHRPASWAQSSSSLPPSSEAPVARGGIPDYRLPKINTKKTGEVQAKQACGGSIHIAP